MKIVLFTHVSDITGFGPYLPHSGNVLMERRLFNHNIQNVVCKNVFLIIKTTKKSMKAKEMTHKAAGIQEIL